MDPGNPWIVVRALIQAAAGDFSAARETVDGMQAHSPKHLLTQLAIFLRHCWDGERDSALEAVPEGIEIAARWDDAWPLYLAGGYALIGEEDQAFKWLDHSLGQGITNVAYLREYDPFLAPLREDPRFEDILRKAGRLAADARADALIASEL